MLVDCVVLGRVFQTTHMKYGLGIKRIQDVSRKLECGILFIYSRGARHTEIGDVQEMECLCTMNSIRRCWCCHWAHAEGQLCVLTSEWKNEASFQAVRVGVLHG